MWKIFAFFLGISLCSPALAAFDYKNVVESLRQDLEAADRVRLAKRTEYALERILIVAAAEFRREAEKIENRAARAQLRGALVDAEGLYHDAGRLRMEGDEMLAEFEELRGYLPYLMTLEREAPEMYAPMSEKIRGWYHTMRDALGENLCILLHLDDIQVINESTPVVLRLKRMGDNVPDSPTFELYFDPWCGVVAYWTVWSICTGATSGTGAVMFCTPAAMLAEEVTFRIVAPAIEPKIYKMVWQS